MLHIDCSKLKWKKNLLAFSAGVDSSALFFLLLEHGIEFDIALVNYGVRENAKKEEEHAHSLAKKHNIVCYSTKAPSFTSHFEQNARNFRYEFFEELITTHNYDNLITAHQLNDQLEWFLMRLSKGAGLSELLGLEEFSQRENYNLIRPTLCYSKDELLEYLNAHNFPYFVDESNVDQKYERNRFRKAFSDPLLAEFKSGIAKSFEYMRADKETLEKNFETTYSYKKFHILKLHKKESRAKAVDLTLKKLGYLLSSAQREEINKIDSLVIGGEWAVEIRNNLIYIAPYVTITMPKKFKELCRVLKIPQKIRAYLFHEEIDVRNLPV